MGTLQSVFLFSHFGYTEVSIGNYFAYVGLWIVITQGFLMRQISRKFNETQILRHTLFFAGLSIMMIFLSSESSWLYFIVPFMSMAIGLSNANLSGLISRSANPAIQGEVLGISGSVNSLALLVPQLLAGPIAATFTPGAPIMVSSAIIIIGGIYFVDHIHRGKNRLTA